MDTRMTTVKYNEVEHAIIILYNSTTIKNF